jgi:hypothetical protein
VLRNHWHISISMVGDYDASVVIFQDEQPDGALRINTVEAIKPRTIRYDQCPDLEACQHSRRPKAYQKRGY